MKESIMADAKDEIVETTTAPAEPVVSEETKSEVEQTPIEESTAQETEEPKEEAVKSEDEPKEGETTEEAEKPSEDDEVAKKRQNDEMAKQRIAQKNQKTRAEVLQTLDDNYAPKTQEDLVAEGVSESDAKIQALREEMNFKETRNAIADLNTGLKNDAELVMRDHPVYDDKSPEFDPEFTKEVEEAYKQAARLQIDDNGVVLNAEIPLGEFYERMAKIRNGGVNRGAVQREKDKQTMESRVESTGSTNTKSSDKSASDMTIEEMEAKYGIVRN